jgi:hypothetical protein
VLNPLYSPLTKVTHPLSPSSHADITSCGGEKTKEATLSARPPTHTL